MASSKLKIEVANPSQYVRNDYIETNLDPLIENGLLKRNSLSLYKNGNIDTPIPFQIDSIIGENSDRKSLSFLGENISPGPEDYSETSETFFLEEVSPEKAIKQSKNDDLNIDYYHTPISTELGDDKKDGFNINWDKRRKVYGVKLRNKVLEIYISCAPSPQFNTNCNYSGSIASVLLKKAPFLYLGHPDNMLSPQTNTGDKLWGQIEKIVFFPPLWEIDWFVEKNLLNSEYDLIYSNIGPIRATITLRSQPITLSFSSHFNFSQDKIDISCNLYRSFSLYPERPFYNEDLFVLSSSGQPISFRPYYQSKICFPSMINTNIARNENIPDYFAVWKNFLPSIYHGYGFASNSHIRDLAINDANIKWRLQLNFYHRMVHYFMFNDHYKDGEMNFFHTIGHLGWYENIFKPIEVRPVTPFSRARSFLRAT